MSFRHYLNVYGPDDLLLYSSDPLPLDRVRLAKGIAQVGPADPDALGSYPLTHEQAQKITGGALKLEPGYSVLLEPMVDDDPPSHGKSPLTTDAAVGRIPSKRPFGRHGTTATRPVKRPRRIAF
ncbi:MAG: hypothetical protein JO068_00895 [Hyphomicrobiales bacterium]|nr:hypothetical protein [Hyphomicrobiales bacterium]